MSILVVSVSHATAPLSLLARLTLSAADADKLATQLVGTEHIDEAVVLSTCNRTEVYAHVSRFHAGLEEVAGRLSHAAGIPGEQLHAHCTVSYDSSAVAHAFAVASGLSSMVVGETQILGQFRAALVRAQQDQTVGPALNSLFQQGIRVGKRVHTETGIAAAGRSLVSAGIEALTQQLGPLAGRRVLIMGAGGIATLAAHSVAAAGGVVSCTNRTDARAQRLAAQTGGTAVAWATRGEALADAEIVITCAGAAGHLVTADDLAQTKIIGLVDLALPADVDPAIQTDPRTEKMILVNLESLLHHESGVSAEVIGDVAAGKQIVAEEVAAFLASRRALDVAPTVVALRSMAADVTAAELERLDRRLPGLDDHQRDEVTRAVRRVVDKLLHAPTVRVQRAAEDPDVDYAAALRELFALDPHAVDAVLQPRDPELPDLSDSAS